MDNIQKFIKNNQQIVGFVAATIIIIGIIWGIQNYLDIPKEYLENVEVPQEFPLIDEETVVQEQPKVSPSYTDGADTGAPVPDFGTGTTVVSPEDLLPKSQQASDFEDQFPVGSGDLTAKNFLTAGYNVGVNTVSSSLRNANLQIRSDVPIPVKQVGPWSQSTILPDMNRKTLEIGS